MAAKWRTVGLTMVWIRLPLLLVCMSAVFACTCTGSGSPDRAAEPATQGETEAIVAQFLAGAFDGNLQHLIEGERDQLLPTVAAYLDWLASRPSTAGFAVNAEPRPDGTWTIRTTLKSTSGSDTIVECIFRTAGGAGSRRDCPQLTQLWTAYAPSSFASAEESKPFIPFWLSLPDPLPGSYRLERIDLLGQSPSDIANPFVVRAVFVDPSGSQVVLSQQPWGVAARAFADYQQCSEPPVGQLADPTYRQVGSATVTSGLLTSDENRTERCATWTGAPGSLFLLTSNQASSETLTEFVERMRLVE